MNDPRGIGVCHTLELRPFRRGPVRVTGIPDQNLNRGSIFEVEPGDGPTQGNDDLLIRSTPNHQMDGRGEGENYCGCIHCTVVLFWLGVGRL